MKKAGILMLTLVLVAAMFSGCRRRNDGTTNTTMIPSTPGTTQTTTRATMPSTTMTRPETTGVIPDATDLLPDSTDGTGVTGSDMGRGRMGPRY